MNETDLSLAHVLARLDALAERVTAVVAERRESDPNPDDQFRGLYMSETDVDRLLGPPTATATTFAWTDGVESAADVWEAEGALLRLRRLARIFGLDLADTEILIVALAPDLDPRFERLYGYLHDDVTRGRATIGLALELCGLERTSPVARQRLAPTSSLVAGELILVEEADRPILSRSLRVPDRVTSHLLGVDALEPGIRAVLDPTPLPASVGRSHALERALQEAIGPIYLRESGFASAVATAASSAAAIGAGFLTLDLSRLAAAPDPTGVAAAAIREARLLGHVLIATPVEALLDRSIEPLTRLAEAPCPVVLVGRRAWDPAWSWQVPVLLEAPTPSHEERLDLWRSALAHADTVATTNGHLPALLAAAEVYRLAPPQVGRAALSGALRARSESRRLEAGDLQAGARAQNAAGLERLARRVEPRAEWDDLVLPDDVRVHLRELVARARHRDRVLDMWRVGSSSTRGRGITALFAGESGTGKTLAAEIIATALGLDLYVIDLSTVVDKYIGETEKNLDRIFDEADRVNGVLLFDEADAIFGKRSEVRDARDRYANVEVVVPAPADGAFRRPGDPRRRTSGPTSTTRSPAGSTSSSTSRCPATTPASSSGGCTSRPACRRATTSTSISWPAASGFRAATSATSASRRPSSARTRGARSR